MLPLGCVFPNADSARLEWPLDGFRLGDQRLFVSPSEEQIVRGLACLGPVPGATFPTLPVIFR